MSIILSVCITLLLVYSKFHRTMAQNSLDTHPNLRLLPNNCGERIVLYRRVSRRNDVFINQFPFMAALQIRKEKPYPACVGTLINEYYVLTSAFCARDRDIGLINVRFGEYNFATTLDCDQDENGKICNDPVQDVLIENRTIHEGYEPKFKNNIALVRLAKPVNLTTNNVRTICLPTTSELKNMEYQAGQIIMWDNRRGGGMGVLKRSDVHILKERKICEDFYIRKFTTDFRKKFTCGNIDFLITNTGFNGAPLVQLQKVGEKEKYIQLGMWIGFDGSPDKERINKNGGVLFISTTEYMQWILDNLKP